MNVRFQVLLLELARHANSYAELGAAAASEYRSVLTRRLALLGVGVVTSIAGLIALWGAGLVAAWDTSWRVPYALLSALLLVGIAAVSLYCALAARPARGSMALFRDELQKDKELFQQWKSTLLR